MFQGREGALQLIGGLGAIGSGRAVEGALEAAASNDPSDLTATFALPCLACPRPPPPPPASQPAVSTHFESVVSAADAVG